MWGCVTDIRILVTLEMSCPHDWYQMAELLFQDQCESAGELIF